MVAVVVVMVVAMIVPVVVVVIVMTVALRKPETAQTMSNNDTQPNSTEYLMTTPHATRSIETSPETK